MKIYNVVKDGVDQGDYTSKEIEEKFNIPRKNVSIIASNVSTRHGISIECVDDCIPKNHPIWKEWGCVTLLFINLKSRCKS